MLGFLAVCVTSLYRSQLAHYTRVLSSIFKADRINLTPILVLINAQIRILVFSSCE